MDTALPAAAAPDRAAPIAPTDTGAGAGAGERIAGLDLIRGIAVMGILAANIVAFGQPMIAIMYPGAFAVPHTATDDWLWIAQFVLIDGKMRGLFTLLFGAGLLLFMDRAWARGATRWLQVRRLAWLALFGLAHYLLLWRGDILVTYACAGLFALALARLKRRQMLFFGLAGYVLGALFYAATLAPLAMMAAADPASGGSLAQVATDLEAGKQAELADARLESGLISEGRYGDWVAHNVTAHLEFLLTFMVPLFLPETLPLMLIGMALYRYGLFGGDRARPARARLWGWAGLAVGSALSLLIALWAKGDGFTYYGTLAAHMGLAPVPRLLALLGLVALLAPWAARAQGWLAERVRAAGRMAFSNYLGTSLVMLLVFHGWALGLSGRLGRTELYGVVVAAWVVMLLWSQPWLARFRYGPLEWVWRCLTYGRRFPLRR